MRLDSSISDAAQTIRDRGDHAVSRCPRRFGAARCFGSSSPAFSWSRRSRSARRLIIGEFRERALSNGERELENTVLLLSRHFDQQLDDTEVPLNDLIAQIHAAGVASPEVFRALYVHARTCTC